MAKSLADIARELAAEEDLPTDRAEAAERLASLIREERPTASVRGSQNAARAALGQSSVESDIREGEASRRPAGRSARAQPRRRARRRRVRVPALGMRRAASVGGLVAQAIGLVALYWLLRYSGAAARIVAGIARALEWLRAPLPLGASPAAGVGAPARATQGVRPT